MRTRDLKRLVRTRYPTAVLERNGDVLEINVLLPFGESEFICYARNERDCWQNAWKVVRDMLPLEREQR